MVNGSCAYAPLNYNSYERPATPARNARLKMLKKRGLNKKKAVLTIAVIFAICLAICYRYVSIASQVAEYSKLEAKLRDLESRNLQLSVEIDRSIDINSIEEYAMSKLGMVKPQKYQIVYVNPQSEDKMENVAKKNENKVASFFGVFSLASSNEMEYLQ